MGTPQPSIQLDTVDGACLVLVGAGAGHGYDVARHFAPDGSLGEVLTLSRPVVYRALKSLEAADLVDSEESVGVRGQLKWRLTQTTRGAAVAREWLTTPVTHVRELRTAFLVRYLLVTQTGGNTAAFVAAQRDALEVVTASLLANRNSDAISMWRREQARAALRFLDELAGASTVDTQREAPLVNLSARNQLRARVTSVKHGDILSSVRIDIEPNQSMTSTITREAVDELRLAPGSEVVALCKATDVMLAGDQSMID